MLIDQYRLPVVVVGQAAGWPRERESEEIEEHAQLVFSAAAAGV